LFKQWQRVSSETEPPNLIGVMNLFMVLIPFLLMGAAFFKISVIPSSLPTHTPQTSDVPMTPKTVTINLVIEPNAMRLSGISTSLSEEELAGIAAEWPKGPDGKYPLKKLVDRLKEIKDYYEKSNTLIVLPHPQLKYETLVEILDASRDYAIAMDENGEPICADLFPVVVFSRFIPPPKGVPVDEGEGEPGEGDESSADEGDEAGGEQ
jgi:biopolymer transport protein ExbD